MTKIKTSFSIDVVLYNRFRLYCIAKHGGTQIKNILGPTVELALAEYMERHPL